MKKGDIRQCLRDAELYCEKGGHRFTEARRHVLEIIAAAPKPLGAYDVLAALGEKMSNPKPPTAYRAIEFLTQHGFIHRIESLNAYVVCRIDHRHDGSQFMICDNCGGVTEAHLCDLPAPLAAKTRAEGFRLSNWSVELHGHCRDCTGAAPSAPVCHHHHHH